MTRLLAALLLLAGAAQAQAATCLFNVGGTIYHDGPCRFMPYGGDGSFEMVSADGWVLAEVVILEPGVAEGWWNGASGAAMSGSPLGVLYRDNRDPACWTNSVAVLCAW